MWKRRMLHLLKYLIFTLSLGCSLVVWAEEESKGPLGPFSNGEVGLNLEISEGVRAGFLQTNLDKPDSQFRGLLSNRLLTEIRNEMITTLPFCILSSGGGYFGVSSFEMPSGSDNQLRSQFGATIPLEISIGEGVQGAAKYRAEKDECNADNAIPLTIQLNRRLSGDEIGRINGRFNLLIKTE